MTPNKCLVFYTCRAMSVIIADPIVIGVQNMEAASSRPSSVFDVERSRDNAGHGDL